MAERLAARSELMPTGCIHFTGALRRDGYGEIVADGPRKLMLTHRAAWTVANGPIPEGLFVLHHCDNRRCVNVEHLFLGTGLDNMRDMAAKGRHHNQTRTHCRNGHPFAGENLMVRKQYGRPIRMCRTCRHATQARYRQKMRGAA